MSFLIVVLYSCAFSIFWTIEQNYTCIPFSFSVFLWFNAIFHARFITITKNIQISLENKEPNYFMKKKNTWKLLVIIKKI